MGFIHVYVLKFKHSAQMQQVSSSCTREDGKGRAEDGGHATKEAIPVLLCSVPSACPLLATCSFCISLTERQGNKKYPINLNIPFFSLQNLHCLPSGQIRPSRSCLLNVTLVSLTSKGRLDMNQAEWCCSPTAHLNRVRGLLLGTFSTWSTAVHQESRSPTQQT